MNTVIICNGTVNDYTYYDKYFEKADMIICVDGGANHAKKFGIVPDLLLGDFDSVDKETFEFYREAKVEIIQFPVQKDMTDTELAVETAIERGADGVVFIGAVGSRFDHSLANITLLKKLLNKGIIGLIVNEKNEITLTNKKITITKEIDARISLVPMSEKLTGVTTKGLLYPLNDATIELGSSWGVSNEFASDEAEVTIKSGLLLVIKSRD